MPRRRIPEPVKLLHRVQSTRLSLAKRLNALAQLAQNLDSCLCRGNNGAATGATALSAQDALQLLETINEVVRTQLLPLLAKRHLPISAIAQLNEEQQAWLAHDFQRSIYPLLTPLAVDPAHPFPKIMPRQLYLLVTLRSQEQPFRVYNRADRGRYSPHAPHEATPSDLFAQTGPNIYQVEREVYGLVNLSAVKARWIRVPALPSQGKVRQGLFISCAEVVRHFLPTLFMGMTVTGSYQFRVLCAELPIFSESPSDAALANHWPTPRKQLPVMHVDMEKGAPAHLTQWLAEHLQASPECITQLSPPLDLLGLQQLLTENL